MILAFEERGGEGRVAALLPFILLGLTAVIRFKEPGPGPTSSMVATAGRESG
jgi:hypothetical protein